MADTNRDVENFALGLIVAVIVYLLWDWRFGKGRYGAAPNAGSAQIPGSATGGCGCGGQSTGNVTVIPIGGQSLSGYAAGVGASPGGSVPALRRLGGGSGIAE